MKKVISTGAALLGLLAVACADETASEFSKDDPLPTGDSGAALPEMGPSGTSSACVSELAHAELAPTNLVIIYDKSGSMGDTRGGFDPALKWNPVNAGMKQFFSDPYSKTLQASLQFFPIEDDTIQTACGAAYRTPAVPLQSAANAAFSEALDTTTPSGGTPTLPALQGALAYAKDVATARPSDKTVVVLVTDGEPGFYDEQQKAFVPGCADNDVTHVAAAAKAARDASPSIATYVVGVGPKLESLNAVAAAGGTSAAVMVDVNDPAVTKATIVSALDGIRHEEVACDFALPSPPAGQELDPNAVNVALKNADGSENLLSYSSGCKSADGWRYDDSANPTRIFLCSAACDAAKTASGGGVSIAFGCKMKVDVQ
jgi:hypothetical protein